MTRKSRHLRTLRRKGRSLTVTTYTGTVCPCTTQGGRDGDYDPLWHVSFPAPGNEDCKGSKLIATSKTVTSLKSFIIDFSEKNEMISKEEKTSIGRYLTDDNVKIMLGACTSSGTEYDLSALNEHSDYITYDSVKYKVKKIIPINPAQIAILEEITKVIS